MVSASVRYLCYQPMYEKIKTWTIRFPAEENLNMEKALFNWPIVLQYDVKAKYRLISRKLLGVKFFHPNVRLLNQPKATRVSFRSINQSNRSLSVRLLFLFCTRIFISRSYENRFKSFAVRRLEIAPVHNTKKLSKIIIDDNNIIILKSVIHLCMDVNNAIPLTAVRLFQSLLSHGGLGIMRPVRSDTLTLSPFSVYR